MGDIVAIVNDFESCFFHFLNAVSNGSTRNT
ncbi:hypothetical protein CY0110_18337 [Crocosphaera chwakensis CCY0110]|uniref:Uncharacterized protein n=1 Tax=Crocosphaera chwakensis CCY0110 TaxID=391612 RepID=A3IIZ9_9CHRO|nr:hypothetical protein CY0110_18337 [Crocosphaera chwakensis CCY0110]